MIKKILLFVIATTFSVVAYAQEVFVADKIVAVVGNSAILYSEVVDYADKLVEQRREQNYTSDRDPISEALEGLLLQKMLYNQAIVDSVEINKAGILGQVEAQVNAMVEEAGSIVALEKQEKKPIFEIKDDMRIVTEEGMYAQMMQMTIVNKATITPGEVEQFYETLEEEELPIIPEQYIYAQISKFPSSTTAAKQRTRERLLEMRESIINGARFDMLARMYSVDPGSAMRGGEYDYMPLEGLVAPFADALSKLQINQVSGVVETEMGFHVMQLLDIKNDLYKYRHILMRPFFTNEEIIEDLNFLDSLANEIRSDKVTFEEAAVEYSDDKYSKQNGGLVTNHEWMELVGANDTRYSRTSFYKEDLGRDYMSIHSLKPGEISKAFKSEDLRGNTLCKIIKLIDIIPSHLASLSNDYLQLEEVALQDKQMREFEKWLDQKIEAMYIKIDPSIDTSAFENKNWVK